MAGGPALSLLSDVELELLVCGLPHLDFDALEKAARWVHPLPQPNQYPESRLQHSRYSMLATTDARPYKEPVAQWP